MPRKKKIDSIENTIEEMKKSDNITVSEESKPKTKRNTKKDQAPEDKDNKSVKVSKKAVSKEVKSTKSSATAKTKPIKKSTKTEEFAKVKKSSVKKSNSESKENSKDKEVAKKTTSKKASKSTSTKKASTRKATKKTTSPTAKKRTTKSKELPTLEIVEYYDLPYRYNQTIIKVLYQTPEILFIYWDISDEDRLNFINKYGNDFFNNTKPVLIVYNKTMNYSFEVEINDFANSWYLHINDTNCEYSVELGRRSKYIENRKQVEIENDYLFVTSSNEIESPNDHILFDRNLTTVYFKDIKTNIVTEQSITSLSFIKNIGKLYNLSDLNIDLNETNLNNLMYLNLRNPSSGNPTSTFK